MSRDASQVSVGKPVKGPSGPIYVAPIETALPTDATTALIGAYTGLGYVSEAGWSESTARDTADIKDWEGIIVLKPQTGFTMTVTFGLLQTNTDVMEFVYGAGNVTSGTGTMKVLKNADELPRQRIVIETLLSDGRIKRTVINNGQITELGEIAHTSGDAITYQVTVTAFPDSNGDFAADYYAKPVEPGGTEG